MQHEVFRRQDVPGHLESIRSVSEIERSPVSRLIDDIFKHFPAAFSFDEPDFYQGRQHRPGATNQNQRAQKKRPSVDWLGWKFYHEFYSQVKIARGTTATGAWLSVDKFIEEITQSEEQEERNQFNFLVGPIGNGKTAFINSLITKEFPRNWATSDFWFVRLNPDYQSYISLQGLDERKRLFLENFRNRLAFVTKEIELLLAYNGNPIDKEKANRIQALMRAAQDDTLTLSDLRTGLTNVVSAVSNALNRKFLLIIDNLDSFFHEHDRYLFISDKGTGEDESVHLISEVLIEFFHVTSPLGRLGCDLLVVLRPDSYQLLKAKRSVFRGFEAAFREDRAAYSVTAPKWEHVIRQRLAFLKSISGRLKLNRSSRSVSSQLTHFLEELDVHTSESDTEPEPDIYELLKEISNQGIRSVVDFFSMYAWLPGDNGIRQNLTKRYIDHQPVGLIAYMLNNKLLFSQAGSKFPNIFMVNAKAFGDDSIVREKSNGNMSTEHRLTYWLKFLILRFLFHIAYKNEESVTIDEVLETFCGDREGRRTGFYEQGVVRLIMGSFAQTHQTDLITVARKVSADGSKLLASGDIRLTPRGKYLAQKLAFTFPYLQLVVDDHYLLLPRGCQQFFRLSHGLNYGYLVKPRDRYIAESDRMLRKKIRMVTKFVALLTVAYKVESDVYAPVLEALGKYGVPAVDMNVMQNGFIDEMRALSRKKRNVFKDEEEFTPEGIRSTLNSHIRDLQEILPCGYSF